MSSPEWLRIFGPCGTLLFKIIRMKKSIADSGHSDLHPVYDLRLPKCQYLKKY